MNTRLILLVVILSAAIARAADTSTATGPVVPLPPFRVDEYSSFFGFTWKAALENDKIKNLRFSQVENNSLAARAGLQADDRVLTIDQKPVANLPVSELQRLFYRDWKPGDTLAWEFVIERGAILPRKHTVMLRLKTRATDPNPPAATATP